ncbi:MAG TPA: hypothetical protein VG870_15100 [Chitinophagaceae bacterium]|nr:hypothetical protein [Chitinophagaceae bacterium]
MQKKKMIRLVRWTAGVSGLLVAALALHVYWVTRPGKPDAHTLAMARFDLPSRAPLDSAEVMGWFSRQPGLTHALVNPRTHIAVFTYYPVRVSADSVLAHFNQAYGVRASRVVPGEEDLLSGCPVAGTSRTYRVVQSIRRLF